MLGQDVIFLVYFYFLRLFCDFWHFKEFYDLSRAAGNQSFKFHDFSSISVDALAKVH